jgi:hypothetical protein
MCSTFANIHRKVSNSVKFQRTISTIPHHEIPYVHLECNDYRSCIWIGTVRYAISFSAQEVFIAATMHSVQCRANAVSQLGCCPQIRLMNRGHVAPSLRSPSFLWRNIRIESELAAHVVVRKVTHSLLRHFVEYYADSEILRKKIQQLLN